ncbi:MAG: hypothetical protein ACJARP_000070 [Vicingaceae bacterium]|jgi:hypothetical protein
MKKLTSLYFLLYFSFFILQLTAQTGFTDNFNDSNFTTNPVWSGETSKFEINPAKELQLNNITATSTNETYLTTTSTVVNSASWEFSVRLNFNPSTSNFAKVYLISDSQDLTAPLNGYYVKIGGQTGTVDNLKLYRQDGLIDTLLIDGSSGTVATAPNVKVRVTKSANNQWSLFLDQTGVGSAYQLQGLSTESKFGNSSYFGVLCNYTSTRSDKFFFDDFVINGASFQDTSKPILNQVTTVSNNKIEIFFNERLDVVTALNLNNYTVNQSIGNPSTASFIGVDSSAVELTFSTVFTNGNSYSVSVQKVQDTAGNTMLTSALTFTYFVPATAVYRDIVINELYPDFSPSSGLPDAEFLELFNASNKVFDLNNWLVSDGTSSSTLSNHILRPREYLIICPQASAADFLSYGTVQGQTSFPTLNNTGDNITLRDNTGQTVDFVNYTDSWYRDNNKDDGGYSLEQINPFTDCIGASNFIAATNTVGGTPGSINSTFDSVPDQVGPLLVSVKVLTRDTLLLEFDESIDTNTVVSAIFQINQNILVGFVYNVTPDFQSIKVSLLTPLDSGIIYTLSVDSIRDCNGNNIQNSTEIFEFLIPSIATYRDLVINELYTDADPSNGLPDYEFIELFNASAHAFNIDGWILSDASANATLTSQIIKPGEYLILCPLAAVADFSNYGTVQGLASFPSLNNTEDNITLQDNNGQKIDFVNYKESWFRDDAKKGGGFTLELINPFTDCIGRANFIAAANSIGGTPGSQNSTFDTLPDHVAPKLLDVLILNDTTLLVRFNELMDSVSLQTATYALSPAINLKSKSAIAPDYEELILTLNAPLDSGIFYSFSVIDANDCSGNAVEENARFIALPDNADSNDLVINEILFNSRSGSVDFVELYNRSEKVITLEYWQIANFQDDTIANLKIVTEVPVLVFPKEYIVLTENKANIIQQYPLSVANNILEIKDLPTYNDDEGTVYLFNSNQEQIDQVEYKDDYHFALLVDEDGVSLERISSERESLDESNWHSASEKVGFATPGYKNSQDFTNPRSSGTVSLDPQIISPNNDGFQDILTVNYKFNAPGFAASVSIFDRNGRLIKKLINNELLGSEGSFFWDGITDENSKARIGVYVVLFEAFNLNGDKELFKNVVTVASQLD